MEPKFLDTVIDAFMNCDMPETLAIHFPMLLPFITVISKSKAHRNIVDEFCGALVQKASSLSETPNVSVDEMKACWLALAECWELHCLRKLEAGEEKDSLELFCVMLNNLVLLCQQPKKETRYLSSLSAVLSTSIARVGARLTTEQTTKFWVPLLASLSGHEELQQFAAVPADDASQRDVLTFRIAPMMFGLLCGAHNPVSTTATLFTTRELHFIVPQWCETARDPQTLLTFLTTADRPYILDDALIHMISEALLRWHATEQPLVETIVTRVLVLLPSRSAESKLIESLNNQSSTAWLRLLRLSYVVDSSTLVDELLRSCRSAHDMDEIKHLAQRVQQEALQVDSKTLGEALAEGAAQSLALWTRDALSRHSTQQGMDDHNSDSDESDDNDEEDESSAASSSASSADNELVTSAEYDTLLQWCELLHGSTHVGTLVSSCMQDSPVLWAPILRAWAALAPRLYPESLVSDYVLHEAIAQHQEEDYEEEEEGDRDACLD